MTKSEEVLAALGARYFMHTRHLVSFLARFDCNGGSVVYETDGRELPANCDIAFAEDCVVRGDWKEITYVDADRLLTDRMAVLAVDHSGGAGHGDLRGDAPEEQV